MTIEVAAHASYCCVALFDGQGEPNGPRGGGVQATAGTDRAETKEGREDRKKGPRAILRLNENDFIPQIALGEDEN